MDTFMSVVDNSLVAFWPRNRPSINPKQLSSGAPFL